MIKCNCALMACSIVCKKNYQGSAMVVTTTSEEVIEGDDMIDIDTLLDDDALMSMTFD